jgi:hypothetical protein
VQQVFQQHLIDGVGKGTPRIYDSKALSLYSYGAQNPVVYLDPDGNDVILFNAPKEANFPGGPYGHNGVLVGNDKSGWLYSAKNGPGNGNSFASFKTLSDFKAAYNAANKGSLDKHSYKEGWRVKTSEEWDKRAQAEQEKDFNVPYNVIEQKDSSGKTTAQECADHSRDVIEAGNGGSSEGEVNITTDKKEPFGLPIFTGPNDQSSDFKKNNPQGGKVDLQ